MYQPLLNGQDYTHYATKKDLEHVNHKMAEVQGSFIELKTDFKHTVNSMAKMELSVSTLVEQNQQMRGAAKIARWTWPAFAALITFLFHEPVSNLWYELNIKTHPGGETMSYVKRDTPAHG